MMLICLILFSLVMAPGVFAPVLSRSGEIAATELQLFFDPTLLKQHVSLPSDYGEMPHPPPPPPDTENHYRPILEDEYY